MAQFATSIFLRHSKGGFLFIFTLTHHHCHIFALEFLLLILRHLMHQTCHQVLHHQILHWHRFECSDEVIIRRWQTLEQSHDDVFFPHSYLQTHKLIHKCFDLVGVVQKIVALLDLVHKELAANKEDVIQTLCLLNATKGFSHLPGSFATLHIRKLVVRQVEANDEHSFFYAHFVLLQHFGIRIGS